MFPLALFTQTYRGFNVHGGYPGRAGCHARKARSLDIILQIVRENPQPEDTETQRWRSPIECHHCSSWATETGVEEFAGLGFTGVLAP